MGQLLMPLEAYKELLKSLAEASSEKPWHLPYERRGKIRWEEVHIESVELSGALCAHVDVQDEVDDATLKSLADWLVGVGLGNKIAPPEFLTTDADVERARHSSGPDVL